jgi:sec-independent protein translocase protein TatB
VLNFSPEKILIVMVVALVVLGPHRLPGAAKSLGKVIGQLRQMSGHLQNEVNSALGEPREALMGTVSDLGLNDLRQSIRGLNPLNAPAPAPAATPIPEGSPSAGLPGGDALGAPLGSGELAAPLGRGDLPPAPDDPSLN